MCPSFTGTDLRDAINQATRRDNTARCARLRSEARRLADRTEHLADRLEDLRREMENYRANRDDAMKAAVGAALLGVISTIKPTWSIARGLVHIARTGQLASLTGLGSMIPVVSGLIAFQQALDSLGTASRNDRQIQEVRRVAERVKAEARAIERDIRILNGHADAYGCKDPTS